MERSLSILLPVHNAQATLSRAVAHLLEAAEDLTDRFEILIIDDGSTDDTMEIAHEAARRFPQVELTRNASRRGLAAAVQMGIEKTHGEIICIHEGSGAVETSDLRRLWNRRNQEDLVMAREGGAEEQRWIARLLGPQTGGGLPATGGFHMLRRDAIDAVERNEPLVATAGELRLRRDAADDRAARRPRRPKFIERLRELALGE